MLYFSLTKKIIITVFCSFLALLALPNFVELDKEVPLLPKNTLNLGLDLRGGSYLLLEIDNSPVIDQKLQNLSLTIRNYFKDKNIKVKNLKLIDQNLFFFCY